MEHLPSLDPSGTPDEPSLNRIEGSNTLEPGQYWRAVKDVTAKGTGEWGSRDTDLQVGDIHLVVSLFYFEGVLHSVTVLGHPRNTWGDQFSRHTFLANQFFDAFERVSDEDAAIDRAAGQAAIMAKVQSLQQEMLDAQINPLQLPGVQEAAKEAVERFEHEEASRVQSEVKDKEQRESDLRRIHRRAARRSEAKGNPIAVRKTTISDRLDVMISEGVTADGVRDLQIEAGRRVAIAEATSKWLKSRTEDMGSTLKRLTPYVAEQAQVAMALSSKSIDLVKQISRGIASLNLYTGAGVDVFTVREGEDAPSSEPLTIVQGKLAMDEELAVHVDVEESFDCSSTSKFFTRLADNDELLRQVLPSPRCVVSVQVTRRNVEYSEKMSPFERVARDLENKRVFLLVRNGHNVHAVYSCEPSHEAAERLFPTRFDIQKPFQGIDGSTIGLQDVAFGKAVGRFEDQALHYRRFLILLCGLDHRLNLFGDFAPPESKASFMSVDFQQRYMRFLENDDPGLLLGGQDETVYAWMRRHNQGIRSGSRVVVDSGNTLSMATALVRRENYARIDRSALDGLALIASEKAGNIFLQVPVSTDRGRKNGSAWLTGPDAYRGEDLQSWWLCIDRVKLAEVRRYIYDRDQRFSSINWLRTLRRVERVLQNDQAAEAKVREHIRQAALEAKVLPESEISEAIDQAVATWRADHRGAPVPSLNDKTGIGQLMSLVFPVASLADSMAPLVGSLCDKHGLQPLMLTRTGKNQFALYSVVPEEERKEYGSAVVWSWVRRHLLKVSGSKASLGSASTVWLLDKTLEATEEVVTRWPELDTWLHTSPEPIRLPALKKAHKAINEGSRLLETLDTAQRSGDGIPSDMLRQWLETARASAEKLTYTQNFYLTVPIAVYQVSPHAPPVFAYARASFLDVVRVYGTAEQLEFTLNTRGFRSESMRKSARSTKPISWRAIIKKTLESKWLQRSGELSDYEEAPWVKFSTHKPGGYSRSSRGKSWIGRGSTRAERRSEGGRPLHDRHSANLSWSRAIDHLMGVAPLHSKAFYRSVEKRVKDIWHGISSDGNTVAEERKAERVRRFEAPVKAAIEIAGCLWDDQHGRSVANRYLSGRCAEKKAA
ncbi:hypothetical protein [Hydrogenophaga sp. NFH-34]|uniref:hypothetical protein n=1 Tax=Hydrogenophaga sp. NFH-34 TaxID=2744446 RepID=UPI001F1AA6CC|nr:hypothetical protein [Hydrogenophaga sp. NFH-34]